MSGERDDDDKIAGAPDDISEVVELADEPGAWMTRRMLTFCEAYLKHGNATRACREAAYSGDARQLGTCGSRLLRNAKVATYIAKRQKVVVTEDMITQRLWDEAMTAEHAGARVRAGELLGKTHRMFVDHVVLHDDPGLTDETLADRLAELTGGGATIKALILARLRGENVEVPGLTGASGAGE
jgi:hypothetical protein